jgi:hypothetical protein
MPSSNGWRGESIRRTAVAGAAVAETARVGRTRRGRGIAWLADLQRVPVRAPLDGKCCAGSALQLQCRSVAAIDRRGAALADARS